jgi:hypothetical protein
MSLVDARTGIIWESAAAWWAEVERRAAELHGPQESRYGRRPPKPEPTVENTWSDEPEPTFEEVTQEAIQDDHQRDSALVDPPM